MRLTEMLSAYNLEFNPCNAQEKLYFTHIENETARELRKLGQEHKKAKPALLFA